MEDSRSSDAGECHIRIAGPSDAATVQCISADAYIPTYAAVVGVVPKPAQEDYLDRIALGEVWLLETDTGPSGVIVLETMPDHLMVYSIAIRSRCQGRGYGKLLLGFAERHAASLRLSAVRLYTNRRMKQNLEFYRQCGYRQIGTRPHPIRDSEIVTDMMKEVFPEH